MTDAPAPALTDDEMTWLAITLAADEHAAHALPAVLADMDRSQLDHLATVAERLARTIRPVLEIPAPGSRADRAEQVAVKAARLLAAGKPPEELSAPGDHVAEPAASSWALQVALEEKAVTAMTHAESRP
ncbi:hypothetical protein OOK41_31395 [Micromonospora sp. NBC_01655]|uniref:hypothetical protein n=1 Tax=Micromonospora sp. NBC_01655 TaxID=2975983 RepID=UPI00225C4054|nr:hypothetical protein [Micromonospora sp. NBC_01655]MCX4474766.1 hypothetical protein [Micromonospora sp. NBC_01655]